MMNPFRSDETTTTARRWLGLAASGILCFTLAACASEPPPPAEPVEPELVEQKRPEPKPQPPQPVHRIQLQYPDGPVTFTSRCDYSAYVDKLRTVHSSDRNVHAALKHVENQGYGCEGRIERLEEYLRNLGALD